MTFVCTHCSLTAFLVWMVVSIAPPSLPFSLTLSVQVKVRCSSAVVKQFSLGTWGNLALIV